MCIVFSRGPERTTPSPPSYQNSIQNATFPFSIPRAINFSGRHSNQIQRSFTSKASNPPNSGVANYRSSGDESSVTSFSPRTDGNAMTKFYTNGVDGGDVKDKNRESLGQISREQGLLNVGQSGDFDVAPPAGDNFSNELTNADIKPSPGQLTENWMNGNPKLGEYQDSGQNITFEPQTKRLRLCVENNQRAGQEQDTSADVAHAQSQDHLNCTLVAGDTGYSMGNTDFVLGKCKTEDTNW